MGAVVGAGASADHDPVGRRGGGVGPGGREGRFDPASPAAIPAGHAGRGGTAVRTAVVSSAMARGRRLPGATAPSRPRPFATPGAGRNGGVDGARGRRGSTAFAGARGVARRLGERGADAPDERAGWSGRRRGRARPARGPGRLDLLGGGSGRARDRAGGVQRPPRRPSRDRAAVRNERGGAPPGLPLDHPPPRRRAAGGSAARAPLVEARAGPGVAPAAGMRARSAGPLGAAGARRGRSPSRIGAHPQAARSSVAAWTARRPAPSAIWWRHDVPSATTQSSAPAARTAGRSDSSPIARETSAVSAW